MKFNQKYLFVFSFLIFGLISCNNKCSHKEKDVNDSRPDQAITYKEMASMFNAYDTGQKKVLDEYRGKLTQGKDPVETISHFYDLQDLKQYIAYLEKLSKKKNIELTGIRIFSAAYPKNHIKKELQGRHTLVFMPTAKIDGDREVAYEPLYSKKGNPIKFTEFLHKFSSKETKQVVRASFLPLKSTQDEFLLSSGANKLKPSPPM